MADSPDRAPRSSVENRYRVLLETGRILTGTLSLEDLYVAIHRETAKALSASQFSVSLYDQGRDLERTVFQVRGGVAKPADLEYRGSDSEVIRSRQGLVVVDDPAMLHSFARGEGGLTVCRSGIGAPMIHHGRVVGVVSACSEQPGAYTEDDLALLRGIADIAAIAIDNALQFAEIERRRKEAERIEEIGRALTSERDPEELLGRVVGAVLDVLDVDGAAVWLRDGEEGATGHISDSGGEIEIPVGTPWILAEELEEALLLDRRPAVVDNIATSRLIPDHLREYLSGGSGVAVPITADGEVVGVLAAGSREPRHFDSEDTAVLQRLARQASVALGNARLHESLQALSLTDPLTGMPNRRRLQIHLEQEIAAARRGRPLSVAIVDLDNFKQINDQFGHAAGDAVLRHAADMLTTRLRPYDVVFRYGGEEFLILFPDSDLETAGLALERLRRTLTQHPAHLPDGRTQPVTASFGAAEFDGEIEWAQVIARADAALYRAKEGGRNRVELWQAGDPEPTASGNG